jgi:hypothetical protein
MGEHLFGVLLRARFLNRLPIRYVRTGAAHGFRLLDKRVSNDVQFLVQLDVLFEVLDRSLGGQLIDVHRCPLLSQRV